MPRIISGLTVLTFPLRASVARYSIILNAILFKVGWFFCLTQGLKLALLITAGIVVVHIVLLHINEKNMSWPREMTWLIGCTVVGFIVETIIFSTGILSFVNNAQTFFRGIVLPPIWLLCIWLLFATLTRVTLKVIFKRAWLACILGLLVSPFSYYVGVLLNDSVAIADPKLYSLLGIAIIWALVMLLLRLMFNCIVRSDS